MPMQPLRAISTTFHSPRIVPVSLKIAFSQQRSIHRPRVVMDPSGVDLQTGSPKMPALMYGTAWKKERTHGLVYEAIKAGFRGIDTAAMKRHYEEALVGEGIRRAVAEGLVARKDLFVQTKFSPSDDAFLDAARFPTIAAQVHASVASSLAQLAVPEEDAYLDSLVLHSPYEDPADTRAAWDALATYVPARIRALGISHAIVPVLADLLLGDDAPDVRPAIVQNRFCAREANFHADVRDACREEGIVFQAFWTLTGNRPAVRCDFVKAVAEGAGVEIEPAWYALITLGAGCVVLNGTTNVERMKADLEALEKVDAWRKTEEGRKVWKASVEQFREMVGGF